MFALISFQFRGVDDVATRKSEIIETTPLEHRVNVLRSRMDCLGFFNFSVAEHFSTTSAAEWEKRQFLGAEVWERAPTDTGNSAKTRKWLYFAIDPDQLQNTARHCWSKNERFTVCSLQTQSKNQSLRLQFGLDVTFAGFDHICALLVQITTSSRLSESDRHRQTEDRFTSTPAHNQIWTSFRWCAAPQESIWNLFKMYWVQFAGCC